ncbi:MAG: hypothetical protein JNJ50_30235 [Acidobacteria bacterium]|nr:hypothetical protein [Acidobacteriota bacterium]
MTFVRSFFLLCCLTILGLGQTPSVAAGADDYTPVEWKEFAAHAADFNGRRVVLTAEVVSVSADYKALDIFDARSKTLVHVSLEQLPKTQRHSLITAPIMHVSVFGLVETAQGQTTIKADKVTPVAATLIARQ